MARSFEVRGPLLALALRARCAHPKSLPAILSNRRVVHTPCSQPEFGTGNYQGTQVLVQAPQVPPILLNGVTPDAGRSRSADSEGLTGARPDPKLLKSCIYLL